jgi:hypothetical protein
MSLWKGDSHSQGLLPNTCFKLRMGEPRSYSRVLPLRASKADEGEEDDGYDRNSAAVGYHHASTKVKHIVRT